MKVYYDYAMFWVLHSILSDPFFDMKMIIQAIRGLVRG